MRTRLVVLVASLLAACDGARHDLPPPGPDVGPLDAADGSLPAPDGAPTPQGGDRLNLNCVASGASITAAECATRLAARVPGAFFFPGPRGACARDLGGSDCVPLCDPAADQNTMNCDFSRPACAFVDGDGFVIVVDVAGRRATVEAAHAGVCPFGPTVFRWASADLDELEQAALCAAAMPAGGFGPARYVGCGLNANCASGDSCTALSFTTPRDAGYTVSVCTHACSTDADCGARGVCREGNCADACGGPCALHCASGFACEIAPGAAGGVCVPAMP